MAHHLRPEPDGLPEGMQNFADDLHAAAGRLLHNAQLARDHGIGFAGVRSADRARRLLARNLDQAHDEAKALRDLAEWIRGEAAIVALDQAAWRDERAAARKGH